MISHWMEDEGRKVQRTFGDVVPELGEVLNCEEEEKKTRQFVVEKDRERKTRLTLVSNHRETSFQQISSEEPNGHVNWKENGKRRDQRRRTRLDLLQRNQP